MNKSIKKEIQQGLDLLKKDDWSQAVTYFQELRNQSFEEANIYYLESFALKEMNFIDESKKSLQMALKIDPLLRFNIQSLFNQDVSPIVQSIRCVYLISEKKYLNAILICDQILTTQSQYLPALYQKGQILFHQGKESESHNIYDKILKIRKDYLFALLGKCQIFEKFKKYEEALKQLNQAQQLHPLQKCIYFLKSKILEILSKFKESLLNYDILLQIDKKDSLIYIKRGICLVKINEFETALWCFDKALTLAPDQIYDLSIKKGQALVKLKKYQEAINLFDQCINHDPENYEGYLEKSYALYEMKDFEIALINCNIALDLRFDIKEAYLLKGNIIFQQYFSNEAFQYYDYVIENFEDNLEAYLLKFENLNIFQDEPIDHNKYVLIISKQIQQNIQQILKLPSELIRTMISLLILTQQHYYLQILKNFIKQHEQAFNIDDQGDEQISRHLYTYSFSFKSNYYVVRSSQLQQQRETLLSLKFIDVAIQLDQDNFRLKQLKYAYLLESGAYEKARKYLDILLFELSFDIKQIIFFYCQLKRSGLQRDALIVLQKAVELMPNNYNILKKKQLLQNILV